MASETGQAPPALSGQGPSALINRLLEKPRSFAFIQAVRLLMLAHRKPDESADDFLRRALRIRPELSLAHPGTDISALDKHPTPDTAPPGTGSLYDVVATFLSLYGASSPLPTFYTEELIEEARADESASRDFLDIFNQSLYVLYYQAYNFYKLEQRTVELGDKTLGTLQYSLLGMGLEALRQNGGTQLADLAYIDLFSRHTRTAAGLAAYVRARTGAPDISVEQCVPRRVTIPRDQRARTGMARLGEAVIGKSVADRQGAFRIHVHGLDAQGLAHFAPGGQGREELENAVLRYLSSPLAWDIVLHAKKDALPGARLGASRLGASAFLSREYHAPPASYRWYRTRVDRSFA